ncbi:Integron integrase IntIPac [Bathymodiolus heckerae thiotrophic gill symbiont]|nr:Integron integrase IntIPac [Bathymodiolus heckerae thiotrophic gill symbiont]SMN14454.1 Integrase [uncultured Candidatus Thioglobus sp.]
MNDNHYSVTTVNAYQSWIVRFLKYHNKALSLFTTQDIQDFLTDLIVKQVKTSAYNQALNAIIFLYNKILNVPINNNLNSALRLKHNNHLPQTLSKKQISAIAYHLKDSYQLIVYLLYGCGLRSNEVLNLKLGDIDLTNNRLSVSNHKYARVLSIPLKITDEIRNQMSFVSEQYNKDSKSKFFQKNNTDALYLFPMKQLCNSAEGQLTRFPIISNTLNYNIIAAAKKINIDFKVTAQTFRYSYALHLLQNQVDIKTLQKLLGHKYARSTIIYSHIAQQVSQKQIFIAT